MAASRLKYYHIDHKSKWQVVPEDQIPPEAKYESVLYVKYRAEDIEASGEDQEYWGPFYIDIDSDSLAEALADLREVILYFKREFGIKDSDYRVYASGGKGFHFELNPYLYMNSKFRKALPLRYRALANRIVQDTGVKNIDMGVYSQGKGRQWRRVNVKRENGNYKVWIPNIDAADVDSITQMIKRPGPVPPKFEKGEVNQLLVSWFNSTKKLADLVTPSEPVPEKIILEAETPECVRNLANNKDVKHNVNSNLLAMQAISYGIARGWDIEQIISYNRKFINEYRSSQYKTPAALEDHFRGLYDYAKERPDKFKFGCKMMLSCVGEVDCNSCQIKIGEAQQSYEQIYVKDGGYWYIPDNPDLPHKQLTNFTVKWLYSIKEMNGEVTNTIELICPQETLRKDIDDGVFTSKANFSKLTGMYMAYFGTDKELPMLKLAIAHLNNPRSMTNVGYTGLVWAENEWHYVTPEGSVSLNGTIDLIKAGVNTQLANETRLNFDAEPPTAEEIAKVFNTMIRLNKPEVIMPMIGWFFNAFFNPHAQFTNETAPSLFVTGLHGSGKTQTMIQLHRLFAPSRPAFPSISATTAFSMNKYASSTNLMPLIFDEFKPTANAGRNNEVGQVSQAIRSSYNKAFESRGTQSREVDQTPFYAPLAIIGEQQLNEGAISDRIILVQMDKQFHNEDNSRALEELKLLPVEKVGAMFLEFAMRVSPREYTDRCIQIDRQIEQTMKGIFESRPRRNIANLLTAMEYVEQFVLLYTGDEELVTKIATKMQAYVDSFKEEAMSIHHQISKMDDISTILNVMNDMADMMDSSLGDLILMPNRHYTVERGILYIDVLACYRLVSLYVKKFGLSIYLTDKSSFVAQLGHKPYTAVEPHKTDKIIKGKNRVTIGIDVHKAQEAGITLDNFKGVLND